MNKSTTHYFEAAKSLPLAMSLEQVQALVEKVGVPSNPPKNGWGFKNYIIMTTSIITISAALLLNYANPSVANYQARTSNLSKQKQALSETVLLQDSTEKKKKNVLRQDEHLEISKLKEITSSQDKTTSSKSMISEELITKKQNSSFVAENSSLLSESQDDDFASNSALFEGNPDLFESGIEPFELFDEPSELDDLFERDTSSIKGSEKIIKKSINAQDVKQFILSHSNGDIKISNSNNGQIEMLATVSMEGKTKEDEAIGLADFDIVFNQKGKNLEVENNWKGEELATCYCWTSNRKNKIKTSTGEKIEIKKMKVEFEFKIPTEIHLDLSQKYANLSLEKRAGDVNLVLFKSDLIAADIDGNLTMTGKYGDFVLGNAPKADLNLFKAKLKAMNIPIIEAKANYSNLEFNNTNTVNLTAFKTDAVFNSISSKMSSNFRYGDLEIKENSNDLELVAFKAKINSKDLKQVELNASYSSLEGGNVSILNLTKAFQSQLSLAEVGELRGNSKYSPIKLDKLTKNLELSTFKGSVDIAEVNADFTNIRLVTKYTDIGMNFNPNSKYSLEAKTIYTSLNMPKNFQNLNIETNHGNHQNNFKGDVNSNMEGSNSQVYIDSFQGKLNLQ